MRKGTIVYIGGMEMPDGNAAAHRALNNSKIFKSLGYDVVFVGTDKTIKEDCYEPISFDGFKSFPSKYPVGLKEWIKKLFDFKHIKFVLDKCENLKFVVCYNMHAYPLKKVIDYCKRRKVKVVADATEWYENKFSLNPVQFVKWIDTLTCMTVLQKKVDGMIAISEYLYNYYQGCVKKVIQLPPLVDVREPIWQPKSEVFGEAVKFVYAGQPGKDKDDLSVIIKAFLNLSDKYDFAFSVIGVTEGEYLNDNAGEADTVKKLGEKIKFFGRLSHEESVRALFENDYCVFIRPKTRKNDAGFPTKFAECVTSGIGVIASDVSNIKDYFPLKNSTLISDNSVESLTDALEEGIKEGKTEHAISSVFDYRNYIDIIDSFFEGLADASATDYLSEH